MQKVTWVTLISPEDWHRLRIDLVENGFSLPYSWGAAENNKTGYRIVSTYEKPVAGFSVGRLTLTVTHPYENISDDDVIRVLSNLFDVRVTA